MWCIIAGACDGPMGGVVSSVIVGLWGREVVVGHVVGHNGSMGHSITGTQVTSLGWTCEVKRLREEEKDGGREGGREGGR